MQLARMNSNKLRISIETFAIAVLAIGILSVATANEGSAATLDRMRDER